MPNVKKAMLKKASGKRSSTRNQFLEEVRSTCEKHNYAPLVNQRNEMRKFRSQFSANQKRDYSQLEERVSAAKQAVMNELSTNSYLMLLARLGGDAENANQQKLLNSQIRSAMVDHVANKEKYKKRAETGFYVQRRNRLRLQRANHRAAAAATASGVLANRNAQPLRTIRSQSPTANSSGRHTPSGSLVPRSPVGSLADDQENASYTVQAHHSRPVGVSSSQHQSVYKPAVGDRCAWEKESGTFQNVEVTYRLANGTQVMVKVLSTGDEYTTTIDKLRKT